mmetsp:Transcript_39654/g.84586  ORF Transcript_39654/g.84586 Transcript_39654/m.84586 type:complete len:573 (-) Transcript_39654:280-1998(-)
MRRPDGRTPHSFKGPTDIFHKTAMCKFHLRQSCSKGPDCNFAHSQEELQPLPNLRCTRICPSLIKSGRCDEVGCRFAHRKEDIRQASLCTLEETSAVGEPSGSVAPDQWGGGAASWEAQDIAGQIAATGVDAQSALVRIGVLQTLFERLQRTTYHEGGAASSSRTDLSAAAGLLATSPDFRSLMAASAMTPLTGLQQPLQQPQQQQPQQEPHRRPQQQRQQPPNQQQLPSPSPDTSVASSTRSGAGVIPPSGVTAARDRETAQQKRLIAIAEKKGRSRRGGNTAASSDALGSSHLGGALVGPSEFPGGALPAMPGLQPLERTQAKDADKEVKETRTAPTDIFRESKEISKEVKEIGKDAKASCKVFDCVASGETRPPGPTNYFCPNQRWTRQATPSTQDTLETLNFRTSSMPDRQVTDGSMSCGMSMNEFQDAELTDEENDCSPAIPWARAQTMFERPIPASSMGEQARNPEPADASGFWLVDDDKEPSKANIYVKNTFLNVQPVHLTAKTRSNSAPAMLHSARGPRVQRQATDPAEAQVPEAPAEAFPLNSHEASSTRRAKAKRKFVNRRV